MNRKLIMAMSTVSVIAVAALAYLVVGVYHERDQATHARAATAKNDLDLLMHELERYKVASGHYPGSLDELVSPGRSGSVIARIPLDPWGRSYAYRLDPNGLPQLVTYGADGLPGGTGDNAD